MDLNGSTLWLFNIAMEAMAHRNRWFTELKNCDFPWRTVSHNEMVNGSQWAMVSRMITGRFRLDPSSWSSRPFGKAAISGRHEILGLTVRVRSPKKWRCPKSPGYPQIIQVTNDHEIVLKPMVTWGFPFWEDPQRSSWWIVNVPLISSTLVSELVVVHKWWKRGTHSYMLIFWPRLAADISYIDNESHKLLN